MKNTLQSNSRQDRARRTLRKGRASDGYLITYKAAKWVPLSSIYHHVLSDSPSPESAMIAISGEWSNGRLHLRSEIHKYVGNSELRLKPGEQPPPIEPEITYDQVSPSLKFSHWDWERSRASRYGTGTKPQELFEYVGIEGNRDDVLALWPIAVDHSAPGRRSPRGRKSAFDWEAALCEAAKFIREERPDTDEEVKAHVAEWFGDEGPSLSEITRHIGSLCRALRVGDKKL